MSRNMTLLATLFIITSRFGKALRAVPKTAKRLG